jgi:hypothetical protein
MTAENVTQPLGEDLGPLTPLARAKYPDLLQGTPIEFGNLGTWLLAWPGLNATMDGLRDHFYSMRALGGKLNGGYVVAAAWECLTRNYNLAAEDLRLLFAELAEHKDMQRLADAVMTAFFEPTPANDRSYTEWVVTGLKACGVDPETVRPEELNGILVHLVGTGRMMKETDFVAAAEAAVKRAALPGFSPR